MKIIETKVKSKFKPVSVCFETREELQYVTKMLGLGRFNIAEVFTGNPKFFPSSMYSMFEDECMKQDIDTQETGSFYIELA
jgi:hypothetical protein